jgi:hypothetical protein
MGMTYVPTVLANVHLVADDARRQGGFRQRQHHHGGTANGLLDLRPLLLAGFHVSDVVRQAEA